MTAVTSGWVSRQGTIAVVDPRSRALLDLVDVFLDEGCVRATLARPPTFEDAHLVSWGALTHEEALRLVECEHDESGRAEYRAELDALFARHGRLLCTLYYCDIFHGQ